MEEQQRPLKKKKKALAKIRINTRQARGPVKLLRLIIEQNPKRFAEVAFGDRGDVVWLPPPFRDPDLDYIGDRLINFIPGFQDLSDKKEMSRHLAIMTEFFPEQYLFYPQTWIFPEQTDEISAAWSTRRTGCYIIKPNGSSQGDGISIVKSEKDLQRVSRLSESVVQEYIDPPLLLYK